MFEPLREEHECRRVDVLRGAEVGKLVGRKLLRAAVEVHDRDVAGKGRAAKRVEQRIGEPRRDLAGPESAWVTGQSYAIDGGSEIMPVAPPFDAIVRQKFGDEVIDAALSGKIPNR